MSDLCHICGPEKHEAPTVICAPCALLKSFGWDDDEVRRNAQAKILVLEAVGRKWVPTERKA